jgi:hypothetical protein
MSSTFLFILFAIEFGLDGPCGDPVSGEGEREGQSGDARYCVAGTWLIPSYLWLPLGFLIYL